MPDWKPEIRRRLAGLKLAPLREAAIVEELAQHLDESYAELLASGMSEADAHRQMRAELHDGELLTRMDCGASNDSPIQNLLCWEPIGGQI